MASSVARPNSYGYFLWGHLKKYVYAALPGPLKISWKDFKHQSATMADANLLWHAQESDMWCATMHLKMYEDHFQSLFKHPVEFTVQEYYMQHHHNATYYCFY
jgi:hypothetical protein